MSWVITFLAYVRMVSDRPMQESLYRSAIYHIWDIQRVLGEDPGEPRSWPMRAQIAIWREMIHLEYQAFVAKWAKAIGRCYDLRLCRCAFCLPPAYGNVSHPGTLWVDITSRGINQECPCLTQEDSPAYHPLGPPISTDYLAGPSTSYFSEPKSESEQLPNFSYSYLLEPLNAANYSPPPLIPISKNAPKCATESVHPDAAAPTLLATPTNDPPQLTTELANTEVAAPPEEKTTK